MPHGRMSFEDFLKSNGIEDDFEEMVCIGGPIWISQRAYDVFERVAATQGCSAWDLVEGVVTILGDDPDPLNYVSDAEGPKHEPEVARLTAAVGPLAGRVGPLAGPGMTTGVSS